MLALAFLGQHVRLWVVGVKQGLVCFCQLLSCFFDLATLDRRIASKARLLALPPLAMRPIDAIKVAYSQLCWFSASCFKVSAVSFNSAIFNLFRSPCLVSFLHLLNEQAGAHPSRAVQHNGFGSHNYFLLDFSCAVCLRLQCIPLSLHFFLQPWRKHQWAPVYRTFYGVELFKIILKDISFNFRKQDFLPNKNQFCWNTCAIIAVLSLFSYFHKFQFYAFF